MRKRLLSLIIATMMIVTMLPQVALAENGGQSALKAPALKGGTVTTTSIQLTWNKSENAKSFELYRKDGTLLTEVTADGALNYVDRGLVPNKSYTYYVLAKNDETEPSEAKSNELTLTTNKAKTKVTGAIVKKSKKARYTLTDVISITGGVGRSLNLQYYKGGSWVTKKTFALKAGVAKQSLTVKYPNTWWKKTKTKWRYTIPGNSQASKYTSKVITLKTKKYYQNPKKYLQLRNKISKHGLHYYTSPVKTNNMSTREDHVEAMIKRAKQYLGDPYVVCRSGRPGRGLDCSGIVMQACYAAGADLWPSNPYRHRFPKYEYESRRIAKNKKLKTVKWKDRKRGDLVFYSKGGIVIHVGIYLGNGKLIHSWPGHVRISSATNPKWGYISKVKRVFI